MLKINNISFSYTKEKSLLKNISFELSAGEHLSIMGESGCGKSTLIKAIYGLFDLPTGEVFFKKEKVKGPAFQLVPGHPKMKYVAQDFGLSPYHTVAENVGKYLSNIDLDYKKTRVQELLSLVEMEDFAQQKALLLSGGEKQRVALAVALAQEPELLLLDEPFSQVDNFRKNKLQRTLFSYLKDKNISCIVATHDGKEALSFSDKALIMKQGEIVIFDNLLAVYNQNTDFYTASLFGEVSWYPEKKEKKILLKPHQIEMVSKSNWEAIIENNYFQGNGFLVEAHSQTQKVYFFHPEKIEIGKKIYLSKKS
ncbi:MAG: ATP-binding cassette domain-containing protein [Capnocytophaga sp.]|nr:ATP-binding cassette domain-containing protein [Capnocytophaga sp.]